MYVSYVQTDERNMSPVHASPVHVNLISFNDVLFYFVDFIKRETLCCGWTSYGSIISANGTG